MLTSSQTYQNTSIRFYEQGDYEAITTWWNKSNQEAPTREMLPIKTTFIMEIDSKPALCVSLYLTNTKEFCIVDNFIGNPELSGSVRRDSTIELLEYISEFAKTLQYKKLFCLGSNEGIKKYYKKLGFTETLTNVSSFIKEIS